MLKSVHTCFSYDQEVVERLTPHNPMLIFLTTLHGVVKRTPGELPKKLRQWPPSPAMSVFRDRRPAK